MADATLTPDGPGRVHDAVVIGGGPAGLHTARLLAERGFDVVVAEEHREIGRPVHCTGILAKTAFDEFDLPADTILNPLRTARFVSPAGRDVVFRPRRIEAVVVDRALFDARLADRARQSGAALLGGTRVIAVNAHAAGVTIATSTGRTLHGRVSVLACGARYALHRPLCLDRPALLLHSAQSEVPAACPGDVEIHFGSETAPHGFAWAVPVVRDGRTYARIGVMCSRHAPRYFSRMVERIGARWGLGTEGVEPPLLRALPLCPAGRTYGHRLLAVGDAAGLVKTTTGGGIYYSLLSASIAAGVLEGALARDDLGQRSLAEYERRWRAHLDAELTAQQSFRVLAQQMSDDDIESLFDLALTGEIMPIVRRTATFNRHRKLILALFKHPPARHVLLRAIAS
jgi:geranylgeranyl reductase family protein